MMKTEFPTNGELPIPKEREHRRGVAIQDHHDNRSEHVEAEDSSGKEATNSKSRVLIVDDNFRFARSAQLFLEHTGNYFSCAVNDPRRALETARSFKPDLVVVDLIMPQADGLEVATQLEADWALHSVPIVFVTALITPEEARDGRRINGHRVVPRPTRGFDLIRVVEENLPCCSGA